MNNISRTYLALNQHWSKIEKIYFDFRVCVVITRGVWEGVSRVSMDTPVLKSHTPSQKKINHSWEKIWGNSLEERERKSIVATKK